MTKRLSHSSRISIAVVLTILIASLCVAGAPGPVRKLYMPMLKASDSEEAEITLANGGASAATVKFTAHGFDGALLQGQGIVNPVSLTLGPASSRAIRARDLFGGNISNGWVEMETNSAALNGAFFLRDSRGPSFDGSEFSASSSRLIFPKVTTDLNAANRIAIINTTDRTVDNLSVSLYENSGRLVTRRTFSVRAFAGFWGSVSSLAPDVQRFDGYVVAESPSGALAGFAAYRHGSDMGMLAAIPESGRSRTGYAAQFGSAANYVSSLALVNYGNQAQTAGVTASIVPANGGPPSLQRIEKTLAPGERWEGRLDLVFGFLPDRFIASYVRYETSSGVFGYFESKSFDEMRLTAARPIASSYNDLLFSHIGSATGLATELTLANPESFSALVIIDVLSPQGLLLGSAGVTLGPNGRWSGQLADVLPATAGVVGGRVHVTSTSGIVAALAMISSGGAIATIPVQGNHSPVQASGLVVSAAAGGTVVSDDGSASLYIPPGALPNDTPIVIRSLNSQVAALNALTSPRPPAGERLVGLVEGTPGGTTFSIPARLRFTLTENLVQPGGAFSVFIVNPSTGAYDPSEFVATVDPSGLTATAEITHFTQFAVSASPQSVRLSAVTPSSAAIGATVTISGSGFSSTPSANGVFFMKPGGRLAAATVSSATPTALNVVVPSGTTTGNLFVQVGSVRSNNLVFRVLSAANQPPAVDAGPNQTVALPEGLALSGIVFDDGLPNGAVVTGLWSQISGPGLVSFVNPSAFNTAASFSAEGSYTLRLTVNDTASSATGDVVVTVQPPPVANQAPAVNAGPDLTVSFPSSATLGGTVTDDGLPNGTLTTVWSKISGPGTVTFANANAASTTAGFSATGTYVLRLSGGDSVLTATDDVTVVVSSSPSSSNQAPTANAGADQSILQPVLAFLSGAVADDGLPFSSPPTASWSKISGPGVVTFGNSAQVPTTARFSLPGTYVLRLTASDGLLTGSDDVTITVVALTSCSNPVSGVVTIDVNATDDVGVAGVQVQLDGVDAGPELLISPYSMQWTTTGTPNGCHVITAIARDAAGNIGTSQLIVQVNNP